MIQYHDDGRYKCHVSMAEYRRIKARSGDLRSLLRKGVGIVRAFHLCDLDPTAAALELVEWMLADD